MWKLESKREISVFLSKAEVCLFAGISSLLAFLFKRNRLHIKQTQNPIIEAPDFNLMWVLFQGSWKKTKIKT